MSEVQFFIGWRPMRSYSHGALATIALWKSARIGAVGAYELHSACMQ